MNFANVKEWIITEGEVLSVIDSQNRVLWQKVGPTPPGPDYSEPFYVENISNVAETLSIAKSNSSAPTLTIEYSTDKTTWQTLGTTSTTALTYTLQVGDKVYLRCDTNVGWAYSSSTYSNRINGCSKVGGNIMSLLYGSSFTGNETTFRDSAERTFYHLFRSNTNLVNAQRLLLPATTLVEYCYCGMFYGCTSLTSVPTLSATTLAGNCYRSMFQGCTALTIAPALPATTLAEYCYYWMFYGCTALTTAPQLSVTTLAEYCYLGMFSGCTSLTSAPTLPATILASQCYSGMFSGCTSLTSAPALSATTLANYCYQNMFRDCTSLTTAPQLPATTLTQSCYSYMFHGCTALNNVTCFATSGINTNYSTNNWLSKVSATGTFTKSTGVTWPSGTNGIPSGWTVVEQQ